MAAVTENIMSYLKREATLFDAELGILRAKFTAAAVDALVVAAVGDGDAKVVYDAAVAVGQPCGRAQRRRS